MTKAANKNDHKRLFILYFLKKEEIKNININFHIICIICDNMFKKCG